MRGKMNWGAVTTALDNSNKPTKNDKLFIPPVKEGETIETIIRFLPAPDLDMPWATLTRHEYKDSNGEKKLVQCRKAMLGKEHNCPICDSLRMLWNDGEADKYRLRKKKTTYYANILVVDDPTNPENNGKVFVLRFGKQIFTLIETLIKDEKSPEAVFDYDNGTDFVLSTKMKGEYANYEESRFKRKATALSPEVAKKADADLHDLLPFVDTSKVPSYDEMAQDYHDRTGDMPDAWVRKNLAGGVSTGAKKIGDDEDSAPAETAHSPAPPVDADEDFLASLDD